MKRKNTSLSLNADEAKIWRELFKNSSKETITLTELKENQFGRKMHNLIKTKNKSSKSKQLVNKKRFVFPIIYILMVAVSMIYSIVPIAMDNKIKTIFLAIGVSCILTFFIAAAITSRISKKMYFKK